MTNQRASGFKEVVILNMLDRPNYSYVFFGALTMEEGKESVRVVMTRTGFLPLINKTIARGLITAVLGSRP